jgi:hypothetical protein
MATRAAGELRQLYDAVPTPPAPTDVEDRPSWRRYLVQQAPGDEVVDGRRGRVEAKPAGISTTSSAVTAMYSV